MEKIILADQQLNRLVDEITANLLKTHAMGDEAISGLEISGFCTHSQVNQFALFRIYQDWNSQISQLTHPYFDFGHHEVQDGLRRFLNLLSGHIRVKREDFEILLKQAVYNNLRLLLNTEETLLKFFFNNTESIPLELYSKHAKYFSDFGFAIQAILKYHEKNQLVQVEKAVFLDKFAKVNEIWEKKEGKSIGEYQRSLFRSLAGLDLDEVSRDGIESESSSDESEAELDEKGGVQERKKPLIRIHPGELNKTAEETTADQKEEPRRETPKTTIPPWVDQTDRSHEVAGGGEPDIPKFSPNSKPPRTEVPAWIDEEKKKRLAAERTESELNPAEQVTAPQNLSQEPGKEEKTVSDMYNKGRENSPKSLNEVFSSKDKGAPSVVDANLDISREKPVISPQNVEERKTAEEKRQNTVGNPVRLISSDKEEEESREPRTLADKFRQTNDQRDVADDADNLGKTIKTEQIPVHKQFQFVQKVFGGSSVKFKVVLDKINKTENLAGAIEVLDKYVFNDPNVNRNDKVSKEFEAMVRGRFE